MNYPTSPDSPSRPRWPIVVVLILASGAIVLGLIYFFPQVRSLLRTQAVQTSGERAVTGSVATSKLPRGNHRLQIIAQTERGDDIDNEISFTVQQAPPPPPPPPSSGGGSGGGSSGGGGGSGGGSSGGSAPQAPPIKPKYVFVFQPEKGHIITGSQSGIRADGKRNIVRLAHGKALLEKAIKVPLANYWFEMTVKDDRPGPVKVAVVLNGKRWKTVTLNKNNDAYRTVRVGMLRRFKGGTIRFTLLNDTYDPKNPAHPPTDRNFEIDSWRLVSEK